MNPVFFAIVVGLSHGAADVKSTTPRYVEECKQIQAELNQRQMALMIKYQVALQLYPEIAHEHLSNRIKGEAEANTIAAIERSMNAISGHEAEPEALNTLGWVAMQTRRARLLGQCQKAGEWICKYHLDCAGTVNVIYSLGLTKVTANWVENLMRAQLASPGLTADQRGRVVLSLGLHLKARVEEHDTLAHQGPAVDKLEAEALQLLCEVMENYAKVDLYPGTQSPIKAGYLASMSLNELRNLRIGKLAPEIEAADLDGVNFKLSAYRGKVVMLTFWGSRCGPCMRLIPHEHELAHQYKDQPFALVGVNSDANPEDAKTVQEKHKITWRSFWCGPKGSMGDIPREWNVLAWPTTYVIDHRGIIRGKFTGEKLPRELIATLVREAEIELSR